MEEAKINFENKVSSAERKLDDIERKIDDKFSEHLISEDDELEDSNALVQTLNEVKAEYKSLCREAEELGQAQKQMAMAFQQELLAQVQQLQMLQDKGIVAKPEDEVVTTANNITKQIEDDSNLSQSINSTDSK